MMRRIAVAVVLFALGVLACAQERFTHGPSGLSFELPYEWTYVQEGDHFEALSPDGSIILFFLVGHATEVEDALVAVAEELDQFIGDAEITTEPTFETINGLTQVYVEGDGEYEGERVDWDLTLVLGGEKRMSIVALGELEANQKVVNSIYASIAKE